MRPLRHNSCGLSGLHLPAVALRSTPCPCVWARLHASTAPPPFSTFAQTSSHADNHTSTASPSPPWSPQPSAERWAAELPDIAYGFPTDSSSAIKSSGAAITHPFAAEQSGGLQKTWLQDLPHQVATSQVRIERYLPNKDDFWRSPPYEALREIVLRTSYHDALAIIMEHDYTFLFAEVMCNDEAPMPHVVYEDFMKALTFCSRQRPPEEQFALPDDVLRDLLCCAAYYCTLDPFYFTSASMFFHKVEQEQHLSPALHSAWVYICTAAGKIDEALAYAVYMEQYKISFDPSVFALMLHPSLSPVQLRLHHAPQTSKGIVLQRRLCQDMSQHHSTTPVAVHAMFVYHLLTLRHTRKWEVLRAAAELYGSIVRQQRSHSHVLRGRFSPAPPPLTAEATVTGAAVPDEMISSRTMQLALSLFSSEKGIRWGPRTVKAMLSFMLTDASAGATVADVVFALLRIRHNERTAMLAELPRTVFSEAEQEELMQAVYKRSRTEPACSVAAPLLRELLAAGSSPSASAVEEGARQSQHTSVQRQRHGSDEGVMRALQDLQRLSMSSLENEGNNKEKADCVRSSSSEDCISSSRANSGMLSHYEDITLAEDDASAYPLTSSLTCGASALTSPNPAKAARELLQAVMALDRESMQQHSAKKSKKKKSEGSTTAAVGTPVSNTELNSSYSPEDQLAAFQASLEAMGTSASLSAWSMQQVEQEAEESRLRTQVNTAWIAPTYQP